MARKCKLIPKKKVEKGGKGVPLTGTAGVLRMSILRRRKG